MAEIAKPKKHNYRYDNLETTEELDLKAIKLKVERVAENKRLARSYANRIITKIQDNDLQAWVASAIWFRLARYVSKGLERIAVIADGYNYNHGLKKADLKAGLQIVGFAS